MNLSEPVPSGTTFSFTVQSFSKLSGWARSPCYYARGIPWQIILKPNKILPDSLSYFIQYHSSTLSCQASFELRVISRKDKTTFVRRSSHLFTASQNHWGWEHYKSWADLVNPENGFISNDAVTFEVEISADPPLDDSIVQVSNTLGNCTLYVQWGSEWQTSVEWFVILVMA